MNDNRSRAWRRAQRANHGTQQHRKGVFKQEKKWKLLYIRSVKLRRAQQLKKIWPRHEWTKLLDSELTLNVLFVCSRNQWRSPTGEKVWAREPGVNARSVGTSRNARRRLTIADIRWADLILAMEEKHKSRIRADFRDETKFKEMHVLDIPDEYQYMDPELVDIIQAKTEPLIKNGLSDD